MTAEENKAIARHLLEAMWNQKDMSAADRYVAANHTPHGPFSDQFPPGPEGTKAFVSSFIQAFPDTHCTIDKQEAEGDTVRTWVTFRGTHTGPLMDIPATGQPATVPVLITDRIKNGQIVETWSEWDPQDMMRQLGVG